ncbi:hypothetical protein vBPpSSYP_128 [Pseudomonas phage vB_PpS_SYP]|nr:hypothetical protein vBPpSSYP_128 [Pseudomonas phage vB_PpS_SYP]
MKILATLKSKALHVLIVILMTLLAATYIDRNIISNDRDVTKKSLTELTLKYERISSENEKLAKEIKEAGNNSVVITKEVTVEVCNAKVKQEAIKSLPTNKREVTNEKATAGIDDSLPDDLKRLLQ